jgi:hypothetical protein
LSRYRTTLLGIQLQLSIYTLSSTKPQLARFARHPNEWQKSKSVIFTGDPGGIHPRSIIRCAVRHATREQVDHGHHSFSVRYGRRRQPDNVEAKFTQTHSDLNAALASFGVAEDSAGHPIEENADTFSTTCRFA